MTHSEYKVKQGDCISSIASKHGLFWEAIWNDPKNSELKEERKDPNILKPGDVVYVLDKEAKQESGGTEECHRFRKKGVPAKLRLRLMQQPEPPEENAEDEDEIEGSAQSQDSGPLEDEPRANVPYILVIDGLPFSENETDDDGYIEHSIPPGARSGKLIIEPGTANEEEIPLQLGTLNPIDDIYGVWQRLSNLGFDCGKATEDLTPELKAALTSFQELYGLEPTGMPDHSTRDKIKEAHGS